VFSHRIICRLLLWFTIRLPEMLDRLLVAAVFLHYTGIASNWKYILSLTSSMAIITHRARCIPTA